MKYAIELEPITVFAKMLQSEDAVDVYVVFNGICKRPKCGFRR